MFYQLYEMNHAAMAPLRATADAMRLAFRNPLNPLTHTVIGRTMAAGFEVIERNTRRYGKPEFGLPTTVIDGSPVKITEEVTWSKPFCNLIHFNRSLTQPRSDDPKILIVAPMSGHYATLLRGTVEALLPSADVYITDWIDARMVPMTDGTFDFDDYVDYVIEILHHLGPNTNLVAVCQPSVPVLAAVARMEAENDEFVPSSMTLMGGPIDTRINPTAVNELAKNKPIEWFEENVIMNVPWPQPGFLRPVYPGFLQLSGFMSMNLDRHMIAQKDFYVHLVKNNGDSAEKHREFYDEYLSVMDLTAEFYLQTVEAVFMRHALPKGELMHRGKPVDCGAIRNVALLTVEGENDDISGVGQTKAAQTLCTNLADDKRMHYMQPDVGHYGVFTGSRFRREIAPRIVAFAKQHSNQPTSAAKRATMVKRVIKGGKSA
ncbi:polyhydroxyalkanoate depolymerase [Agrobacterium vitis]|uniref:Polyhydroxyalkanoate depolymerase n=1 Tax=Agrobacterium vitis TaxID=373 RepID=A0A1S2DW79_AGRVI|nr:polyhydroxyalkanoate depolymerase [Agrobacterium vitis]MCE6076302.1 polyhydroxyalkanoate depolymerase [Agrobacterium vitis]MCF1468240.1 polyhydroxyalkanoate depolymerase [Agrobacterium vitis]MCM2448904.1 polyhydroxyalkanoate depolymerase [Agrobacterium vitis]MCM2469998.1 polyhydroxyalkanoate depolymerase [Agrobacterium vitis]MUO69864.1 polyhydroxyalkanoate depolymerase [Agrobacterium vitis]